MQLILYFPDPNNYIFPLTFQVRTAVFECFSTLFLFVFYLFIYLTVAYHSSISFFTEYKIQGSLITLRISFVFFNLLLSFLVGG